ncbi:MAG: IclR family transcriptional regulator [Pikeienuella sp.]
MGTITKALDLLHHFSASRPEIGLSEFARLAGRDKATVHRHLTELAACGFVEQAPGARAYRLGPALPRLNAMRERTFPARAVIAPIVDRLANMVGELVHASTLKGDILLPLCHADAHVFGVRINFDETEVLPLHATASGLSLLAFGPASLSRQLAKRQIARFTDHTETDLSKLTQLVEDTRARGFGLSDAYFEDDVFAIAAPCFGGDGIATGAIAIAAPYNRARRDDHAPLLLTAAADITRALGGAVPDNVERLWRAAA